MSIYYGGSDGIWTSSHWNEHKYFLHFYVGCCLIAAWVFNKVAAVGYEPHVIEMSFSFFLFINLIARM